MASEKFKRTTYLLGRLSELEYQHKNSFSITSSLVVSFGVSICIAVLQIPIINNLNTFEFANYFISQLELYTANEEFWISALICVISLLFISILFILPIVGAVCITKSILENTNQRKLYYKMIIVPYERKKVIQTLATYSEQYKEID